MLPKGEQKKILKLLNSKHVIERLDALHELRDAGEHAAFAVSKLSSLVQKDSDDLVIINVNTARITINKSQAKVAPYDIFWKVKKVL